MTTPATVTGRLSRPTLPGVVGNHETRLRGLERSTHGHLIYVGTYPGDPNTTDESPPFLNGWGNIGGDYPPLAFAMGMDGYVRLEGTCTGGADGTVVFTLPEGYRPSQSQRFVCALSTGSDFMTLQIDPTGDVTVVARGFDPGAGSISPGTIAPSGTNGYVLTTVGGNVQWAPPAPSAPSALDILLEGTNVGSEGAINLHQGDAIQIAASDNSSAGRLEITIGVGPGAEGQVLTTYSGAATWRDPIVPTPPSGVYPTIDVNGATVGSEPTINFVATNVGLVSGVHNSGTDVEVDIGIAAGGDGQVLQTVAGAPSWQDIVIAKTLQMEWFGAIPVATGPTQVLRVPFVDGASRVFDLTRLFMRLEVAGASPTTITIEKSSSSSSFVPTTIGTVTVAASANEGEATSGLGTVTSGDLVRVNFTALGAGADAWYVEFEAQEEV